MDKLDRMRLFLEVAEAKSFVVASKKLGLSAPAVTRNIAQLENRLKTKLLTRSNRCLEILTRR